MPRVSDFRGRTDDDLAAVHAFAHVIIRFAQQGQANAVHEERAERLSRAAIEGQINGRGRQSTIAALISDLSREVRAYVAVNILDLITSNETRALAEDHVARFLENGFVERAFAAEALVAFPRVIAIEFA